MTDVAVGVNLWLAALIVVAAVATTVTLMLTVRRRAPAGAAICDDRGRPIVSSATRTD